RVFELQGIKVQRSFEDPKCLVLGEDIDAQEITDVGLKALDLLEQTRFGQRYLPAIEAYRGFCGKACAQFGEGRPRAGRQLKDRAREGGTYLPGRAEDREVDGEGKQRLRLLGEVGNAVADGPVHNGLTAIGVGDRFPVALEKQLVHAEV